MNRRLVSLIAAPLALGAILFGGVSAQPNDKAAAALAPPIGAPPPPTVAAATTIAEPLFRERCAGCHEPAQDRAPSREQLRSRTPETILEVITRGAMRAYADGLSPQQTRALAVYLANRQFAAPGAGIVDNLCKTHPPIRMTPSSWNGWSRDITGARFQPNPGLRAADVPRLKVKWAFAYLGGSYGQPTVIGDHLFMSSSGGAIYSLDAKTGCVHWRHDSPVGSRSSVVVERRPGASPSGWVAYFGDFRGVGAEGVGRYYAVDAMTGREVWRVEIDRHPYLRFTGAPVIHKDHLYIPISSLEEGAGANPAGCCTFTGAVAAVDLRTHRMVWKTRVIGTPQPTRRNSAGGQMFGPAGGAIWMAPTIDPKRNVLYIGTGDSYTEVPTDQADAVMAFDLATGRIKWSTQTTAGDNYIGGCPNTGQRAINCPLGVTGPDHDYGASPVLVTLPDGKDILLVGQKSSTAHGFDPDTGRVLWRKTLGYGGALGGIEWGMASDGRYLFVANSDQLAPAALQRPSLSALNPANGETIWHVPTPKVPCRLITTQACRNNQSAAISAIPGLVFSGTTDGRMRAYQARDGKIAWEFDTTGQTYDTVNGVKGQPGGNIDGAGPTIAGGMLYTMSGYSGPGAAGGNPVNVLLAFSVDGK